MLAESTLPGADYQVPIRSHSGRSVNGRGSDGPALFASEEREGRQAQTVPSVDAAADSVPMAKTGAVAEAIAEPVEQEIREDGSLHAGRIWVSPQEMDDVTDWADEAEVDDDVAPEAEMDAEMGQTLEIDEVDEAEAAEPEFERRAEPELVPVAASVFDDDFFRASVRGGKASSDGYSGSNVVYQEPSTGAGAGREVRLFAGASASHAAQPETDELDIPAFLRRSR